MRHLPVNFKHKVIFHLTKEEVKMLDSMLTSMVRGYKTLYSPEERSLLTKMGQTLLLETQEEPHVASNNIQIPISSSSR